MVARTSDVVTVSLTNRGDDVRRDVWIKADDVEKVPCIDRSNPVTMHCTALERWRFTDSLGANIVVVPIIDQCKEMRST